jgi:hypothetical protein
MVKVARNKGVLGAVAADSEFRGKQHNFCVHLNKTTVTRVTRNLVVWG